MIQKRRGVALMITLVVSLFLVVLLGAFLVVNRGNSSLTISGVKRQKAYNSCMSGLHYVWGELELNQTWGAGGFPNGRHTFRYPSSSPKLIVTVRGDRDDPLNFDTNYVEGELLDTGEKFRLTMINNLQNRTVIEDSPLGPVPGRSARIEVSGEASGSRLVLSSILRKKPFVDYSALSNLDMNVALEENGNHEKAWKVRSKDPYVNQVRSNTQILAPSAIDSEVRFSDPPRGGVAKATDDIILDGTSVQSDADFLTQSERTAKGTFQVGTASVDVPGLQQDDLRFPEHRIPLPDGRMIMRSYEKHDWTSEDFEIDTDSDGIPDTTVTRWRLVKSLHNGIEHGSDFWVSQTSSIIEDSGELNSASDGVDSPTSDPGFQNVPTQPGSLDDFPILYESDPDHQMRANLVNGEIALTPGTKFEVDGTFRLEQDEGAIQPNLKFGFTMDNEGVTEFSAGVLGTSAIEDPESNSAALISNGSAEIDGIVSGFGSIFAQDEVTLRAKSGLRAEPDMAVAVHGNRIRFTAEDPPDSETVNTLLQADWLAFQGAMDKGAGYESFENWMDNQMEARRQRVGNNPDLNTGLRSQRTGMTATEVWEALDAELDLGDAPNFGSSPFGSEWTSELTLGQYIRLREFADGGSNSWLEMPGTPHRLDSVVSYIDSQVGTYSRWSSIMGLPMEAFMREERPEIADVFFVGLVHAGSGGIYCDTNGSSLLVEGAVVSQGGISIRNSPAVDFVYNRLYLDDVVREFRNDHIKLDQVYFKLN